MVRLSEKVSIKRLKIFHWILFLVLTSTTACNLAPGAATGPDVGPRSPVEAIGGDLSGVPDVKVTAQAFLDGWKAEDYSGMYALLTSISRDAISQEEFTDHYQGVAIEAALGSVDYTIQSALVDPSLETAQISYQVILNSLLVGEIQRRSVMNMRLERGQWRVEWDDALVLPELAGGNYLDMELEVPARANIYDRQGHAFVAQTDATAVGLYPDQIDPAQEEILFAWLMELTGLQEETIRGLYANFPTGAGWYLPLGEVPAAEVAKNWDVLSKLSGLALNSYKSRYYFEGGVAPHVIGYVGAIDPDEVEEYQRKGYRQDERVGRAGLEKWGEAYLAGKRGGTLYVYNSQGQRFTKLAESSVEPAQAIYTTLDREFQLAAQQALGNFTGAIVVLERDSGRVLAMVSSPSFDPNAFEPINYNSYTLLSNLADQNQPFLNRATQGQYPLGSVFKTITMAAALESELYSPETPYQCGYVFDEIPGLPRYDWTYEHYQSDGRTQPSGLLTLQGGLIRSCNPYFWHIGLDFYNREMDKAISEMARGFGLGSPTGIEGVAEQGGQVPDPQNQIDAINLAIGQGDLLVTPLQVADYIAAIGNGGTLYTPQVIEKIAPPVGAPTRVFEPQMRGKLPVSPETLAAIQEAMEGVVSSTSPRGTAYHVFSGLDINVAGKTGTATSGNGPPHAWFAGYTFEGQEDKPDIAAAVVVENIGEGSDYAAPIFRRLMELYFYGKANTLYGWESSIGVTNSTQLEDGSSADSGAPAGADTAATPTP